MAPGQLKLSVALLTLARLLPAQEPGEFFESRVRPVLSKNCFACHTSSKLGGLQLDSCDHLLKGGNSGPAIVPGQPESSLLIQAVRRSHERFKMPPQAKLSDEDVANLAAWVKMGAVWPQSPPGASSAEYKIRPERRAFWTFQPVRKPAVPEGKSPSAIVRFILARLQPQGLKPVRPADRDALIRRVTFDLRLAAHTRRAGRVFGRSRARCVRQTRGPAARVSALRGALGAFALARRSEPIVRQERGKSSIGNLVENRLGKEMRPAPSTS